jgi:flavodoxin I
MKKVTIIFGSTTGNTETVANMIAQNLNDYDVTLYYVTDANDDCVKNADLVLYGSSTWGYGELQDDFQPYYNKAMTSNLLRGKNVAVFGCGDKENYEDVFCEATELIRAKAEKCGANIVCENLKVDCEPADNEEAIIAFAKSL